MAKPDVTMSELKYYLVFFLDLLGQRDQLRKLKYPENEDEYEANVQIVNNTAGAVLGLKDAFDDNFNNVLRPSLYDEYPKIVVEAISAHQMTRVKFIRFSDTFVFFMPLDGKDRILESMMNVFTVMISTAVICRSALHVHSPLRGGMDIGLGLELEDEQIYGPVLEKAYVLESRFAEYPRVLIGENVLKFIGPKFNLAPEDDQNEAISTFAQLCSGLICKDVDGLWMLDFMGKEVAKFFNTAVDMDMAEAFTKVYEFVESQAVLYFSNGNRKLYCRYERLKYYLNDRKDFWITPEVKA